MKLLVVAPYFYPKVGGLENYAWNICKGLKNTYGWDIVAVASNHEENGYKEEVIEGIKIYRLPYWFKLSNTPINFGWFIDIWKIIKKERPDVVNAHSPVPFIADVSANLSKRMNIPLVLTYHAGSMKKNNIFDLVIEFYENTFLNSIINNADKVICFHTDFIKKYLLNYSKLVKVAPGVDTDIFKYDKTKRPNSVIYVGKIDKTTSWKGLGILIKTLKEITEKNVRVRLNIIGEGNAVNMYKDMVNSYNLQYYVKFIGKLNSKKLALAMQNAKVLVLPSITDAESFGMVLIEAMACGTPVIGSNIGGIPQVIDNGKNGYLFKPGNTSDLANKIVKLIDNDKLVSKFGLKGREKVEKYYTWDLAINRYFQIINELKK